MNLKQEVINEFFDDHLPYKITQLKTHHINKEKFENLLKKSNSKLEYKYRICAIEISFVAGRMFLDFLGIGLDNTKKLIEKRNAFKHDVKVIDLGGKFVELSQLNKNEIETLEIFYHRGNKGSAHFTWEEREIDGWEKLDDGVEIITRLLKTNLYDVVNREMIEK